MTGTAYRYAAPAPIATTRRSADTVPISSVDIRRRSRLKMIIETFIEDQVGNDPQVLLADGLDDAFIGIGCAFNAVPVAIYDRDKVIEILMTRDVMTYEEAWEFFEFNISGAYVGESTPIFMSVMNRPTGQFKDTQTSSTSACANSYAIPGSYPIKQLRAKAKARKEKQCVKKSHT
jgi:hypothetical protein